MSTVLFFQILCIHLKRFRHDFVLSSKIGSYVSFPLDGLDLGPYLHKGGQVIFLLKYIYTG